MSSSDMSVVKELVESGDVVSAVFILNEHMQAYEERLTSDDLVLQHLQLPADLLAAFNALLCSSADSSILQEELCQSIVQSSEGNNEAQTLHLSELCKRFVSVEWLPAGSDPREVITGLLAYNGVLFLPFVIKWIRLSLQVMFSQQHSLLSKKKETKNAAAGAAAKTARWFASILSFVDIAVSKYALRDGAVQYIESTTNATTSLAGPVGDASENDDDDEDEKVSNAKRQRKKKHVLTIAPNLLSRLFFEALGPEAAALLDLMTSIARAMTITHGTAEQSEEDFQHTVRQHVASAALNMYEMVFRAQMFTAQQEGEELDRRSDSVEAMDLSNLATDASVKRMGHHPSSSRPSNFTYNSSCPVYVPAQDTRVEHLLRKARTTAELMMESFVADGEKIISYLSSIQLVGSSSEDMGDGTVSAKATISRISKGNLFDDVLHENFDRKPFDQSQLGNATGKDVDVAKQMRKVQERQERAELMTFLSDDEDEEAIDQQLASQSGVEARYSCVALADIIFGSLVRRKNSTGDALPSSLAIFHLPTVFLACSCSFSAMLRSESLSLTSHGLKLLDEFAKRCPKFSVHIQAEDAEPSSGNGYENEDGPTKQLSLPLDATSYRSQAMRNLFTVLHDLVNLVVLSPSAQHRRSAKNVLTRVLLMLHSKTRHRCLLSLLASSPYSSLCVVLLAIVKNEVLQSYKQLEKIGGGGDGSSSSVLAASDLLLECVLSSLERWVMKLKLHQREFSEPIVFCLNFLRLWIIHDSAVAKRSGSLVGLRFRFASSGGAEGSGARQTLQLVATNGGHAGRKTDASIVDFLQTKVIASLRALISKPPSASDDHHAVDVFVPSVTMCAHGDSSSGSSLTPIEIFSLTSAIDGLSGLLPATS